MCYVGKATKIFFFMVGVLAVAGLVMGLGLLRRGWTYKEVHPCHSNVACHYPIFPDPIPANTAAAPTATITNPSSPTTAATNPTTSTALPPFLSPPSPTSATFGPVHA